MNEFNREEIKVKINYRTVVSNERLFQNFVDKLVTVQRKVLGDNEVPTNVKKIVVSGNKRKKVI